MGCEGGGAIAERHRIPGKFSEIASTTHSLLQTRWIIAKKACRFDI